MLFISKKHNMITKKMLSYLFGILLLLVSPSCDEECGPCGNGDGSGNKNSVNNNLVFKYGDDTEIAMGDDYAVCCGIWEPGYNDEAVVKLFFYDYENTLSFWKIFIVIGEAVRDSAYSLPLTDSPVKVFFIDKDNGNELNGDNPGSTGTITINSFDCGPPVKTSITVNALVESEIGELESVHLTGSFSCTVYSNPARFGCGFSM